MRKFSYRKFPGGVFGTLLPLWLLTTSVVAAESADAQRREAEAFFEKKIRPVLVEQCTSCHGSGRQEGQLRVDTRRHLLHGGATGAAVVPAYPDASVLIQVLNGEKKVRDGDKHKLAAHEVAAFEGWVLRGAVWPAEKTKERHEPPLVITDEDRRHWAFQPLVRPAPPRLRNAPAPDNPIDAFILARLEEKGLEPNPPADDRTLLRRVTFDLNGLPPTSEEMDAFLDDPAPDAYERVVDRLLASPRYGERWGRHWLDLVRYAQTDGYEFDREKPFASRYRDYVIESFNDAKPYNRFVLEQLAGDELDEVTPASLIATGYYRLGVFDASSDENARAKRYEELDDIVSTTSETFLGLTMGCARCHDHKAEPLRQRDYYSMLAFFNNLRPYREPKFRPDDAVLSALDTAETVAAWERDHAARLKKAEEELETFRAAARERYDKPRLEAAGDKEILPLTSRELTAALSEEERATDKRLTETRNKIQQEKAPFDWVLAISERGGVAPPTHVLARGDPGRPSEEVPATFPIVFGERSVELLPPSEERQTTGRRRVFADWVSSEENPLTARVVVNRLWRHHLGRGIVATPSDFGRYGSPPSHPELLDWLAAELIEDGWRLKRLHRRIVTSAAYRRSTHHRGDAAKLDPPSVFLWRQNLKRLEAETLRDSMLAASGELNLRMGGRGFFPRLERQVIAGTILPGQGWEYSESPERARRSVYMFLKRQLELPLLDGFDSADMTRTVGARDVTTVAPQALLLLNGMFAGEQAAALADRLLKETEGDARHHIVRAYERVLARAPTAAELERATAYLRRQQKEFELRHAEIVFAQQVPPQLHEKYLDQLPPAQLLNGPRDDWQYFKGLWKNQYSYASRKVELSKGPFALWSGAEWRDGTVRGTLRFEPGTSLGGVLLRGSAREELFHGYEFLFDLVEGAIELRRHDGEVKTLVHADVPLEFDSVYPFEATARGSRLRLRLGQSHDPLIDFDDPQPLTGVGRFGLRTWGAALVADRLQLHADAREWRVLPGDPTTAELSATDRGYRRALASLCLVLFNLNEFVYVD